MPGPLGRRERLREIAGTDRHQGIVAIVDAAADAPVSLDDVMETLSEPALLLVLDGVTDPHNLGACLRNADAFGAQAVIVPKDRAVGVNATVAKAASGAADTVPVITVTNLARTLRDLKSKGVWILGADAGGESLFDADVTRPGRVGAGRGRVGAAPSHARAVRPHRRHSALGHRREPQRLGGGRHLPLRDARARDTVTSPNGARRTRGAMRPSQRKRPACGGASRLARSRKIATVLP